MAKYLSGRVQRVPQSGITSDRYQYLSLNQAEPNLGSPLVGPSSIGAKTVPPGQQFIIVSVEGDEPGERYWIQNQGGIIPGSISVFDDGVLVGTLSSITQLNFVGAAITASVSVASSNLSTIRVFAPGNNKELLFNTANEFSTSTKLTFDTSNGLLTAGDGITVGAGGTVITTTGIGSVGIGTTNPTQKLHVQGDLRLTGTIYDSSNQPGTDAQILVKNNFGGLTWINQSTIRAGAGGTYQNIQFHNNVGLVDGALNFVFDEVNSRVGIGSTQPKALLDVLGISSFKGGTTIDNLNVTGVTTTSTLAVSGTSTTRNLLVTGVTTIGFVTGTNAFFTGIVTASKFSGAIDVSQLYVTGVSTFLQKVNINSDLGVTGFTTSQNLEVYQSTTLNRLNVSGVSTFTSRVNVNNLNVTGVGTFDNIKLDTNIVSTNIGNLILDSYEGTTQINDLLFVNDATESTSKDSGSIITEGGVGIEKNLNVGGSFSVLGITTLAENGGITTTGGDLYVGGNLSIKQTLSPDFVQANRLQVTGITTLSNTIIGDGTIINDGPILQVSGISSSAYIGGSLGIGITNPLTKLDVRGVITAGSNTSTSGTEILRGYYGDGALSVIGSEYSSGGLVLGYAVKPSTTNPGQFYSSTTIPIDRSAYVVASSGGIAPHRWYIGANQTVAENSSVTMSEVMRLNSSGNLGIGKTNPAYKLDVDGEINATRFVGTITGNADTATRLAIPRNIDIDGDVIGVGIGTTFDGSQNVTISTILSNTGVSAGTYGSSPNTVPTFTVDAKGRITSAGSFNLSGSTSGQADKVATVKNETPGTYFPTFVDSNNNTSAYASVYTDAGITYNPSTNILSLTNLTVSGITTLNGNATIGDASTDTVTFNARINSSTLPSTNGTLDLGGTSNRWSTVYANTINVATQITTLDQTVNGNLSLTGKITPSAGTGDKGILWASDPGGGSGDVAFIQYYVESGENTRLHIGIRNDGDDDIYLEGSQVTTSGNLTVTGTTTLNGNVTIGDATSDTVSFTSRVNTGITPSTNGTLNLGSSSNKWNNVHANSFVGTITGNADTATKLANARNFSISGDVDATAVSFDGSGDVNLVTTLDNTGVVAGTYGSSPNTVPTFTVDTKGRITSVGSFNLSGSTAVATIKNETPGTYFPTFVDANNETVAYESLYTDAGISYNPSTNLLSIGRNINLGTDASGSTATPYNINLGNTYSNGATRDKLKIYLYNDGTEKYGFGVGSNGDIQYHSNTTHDFYIANTKKVTVNSTALIPQGTSGTLDLGGTSNRWSTVYTNNVDAASQITTLNQTVNGTLRVSGNLSAWNGTIPGTGVGGLHLGAASGTGNAGPAITFGARDSSSGTTGQAGIYINSDSTYGTRMYFATTDSYAAGSKVAMSISEFGAVTLSRSGLTAASGTISGNILASTVATGTAPLTVTSTTQVTNLNSNYLNGITATQFFNNMGNNYTTRTDFNASTNFGFNYVQGSTNGPGIPSATQYYNLSIGLGNDYAYSQYAMEFAIPRTSGGGLPYPSVRFRENGTWGSWSKIYAGYADSAGSSSSSTNATTATYLNSAQSSSTEDNITQRINSGFWQTNSATTAEGWPTTTNSWYHLISSTHSNSNYYALQLAAPFFSQNLYYRSTNGSGDTAWSEILTSAIGSANQVLYKNSSNQATTSGKFTFDGNRVKIGPYAGSTSTGNQTALEIVNNGGTGDGDVAAMSFHCSGSYGMHMHLRSDGYFGIGGWSANSWRWYVNMTNGYMYAAGDVVAFVSDERLKQNIQPLENALDKVLALNGFTYNFNEIGQSLGFDSTLTHVGVSAQQVQAVLPEAVKSAPVDSNYLTVQYEKLVPLLIEAIKEQQETITNLQNRLEKLERK